MAKTLAAAFLLASAATAMAQDVPVYGVFEATFTHNGNYSNPYASVSATASFKGPDGATRTIPLFWDGGTTWRVRFSPHLVGTWTWSSSSSDAGLNGKSGSFRCVASTNKGGIRARASAPYHMEHQDGTPFFWFGDTMWRASLMDSAENLNRTTFFHYVDVRAAQGFNYIHANFGESSAVNEGGSLWDGTPGQKVRPSHFQEIDTRIQYMNAKGITVGYMLAWAQDWDDYGQTERLRYARYCVARYSAYNVVFIVSGEYNESLTAADYRAIAQEIENNDPHRRLTAIHGTGSVELFADEAWMDFGDYQQVYRAPNDTEATAAQRRDLHNALLAARDHNKPVVNAEYGYYLRDANGDGNVDKPHSHTRRSFRRASWVLAMAGGYFVTGFGTTYSGGNRDPGPFDVDAPKNDDAEADLVNLRNFFTSFSWWKLNPRNSLVAVPSGYGYCLADIGQTYVVFTEETASASLSLGGAAPSTYSVRRYDPRSGSMTSLGDYSGSGPISLTSPDSQDWAYLIELKSAPSNQPPTVSISANKTTAVPGESVTFSVVASDPDGLIASHVWDWGDATESANGAPPSSKAKAWSNAGTYNVTLTVTDNGGLSATSNVIVITVTANLPPVITSASATPNSGTAPLTVSFSAAATDPEGQALTYSWDFHGDGIYDATGATATYTYTAAGHYDPVVRVSDGTNAVTQQLTVDVDAGGAVTISNLTVGSGRAYVWDLLDVGKLQYIDRRFTFSVVPASYLGLQYLRTANDDKGSSGFSFISFDVDRSVTVYIAHDDRFAAKPSWLSGWRDTGADLISGAGTFSLWAKDFTAGRVTLGGNTSDGVAQNSMYTVVVRPLFSGGGTTFTVTIDFVSTGRPYSLSTAQVGALYYIDRSHTISSLSTALAGAKMIRTANDDKTVTATAHLRFTVNQPATLWVAYDKRATRNPSWLQDGTWIQTTDNFSTTDTGASPMRVFRKSVPAGQVTLGGNHAGGNTGALSNYIVLIRGEGSEGSSKSLPEDIWEHPGDTDGDGLRDEFETAHFLDPRNPDTDGDGEPDETELAPTGRTYWEEQEAGAGGDEDDPRCGLLGGELLLLAVVARWGRRRLRR